MDFDKFYEGEVGEEIVQYGVVTGRKDKPLLAIKVGKNGTIYGNNNKYIEMARYYNNKYKCSVVVASNMFDGRTDPLGNLVLLVNEYVDYNGQIYYMGVSNGASIGARFGYQYPKITRMLLINPPLMINWPKMNVGIEKSLAERIIVVIGEKDPSFKYAELVNLIKQPNSKLIIYEGADHNFNDMLSQFAELPNKYLFD